MEPTTQQKWAEIEQQMTATVADCLKVANKLSAKAESIKTRMKILRGVNILLGGAAFVMGIIIPGYFTPGAIQTITALASVALFIDGLLPSLVATEPPERLQDYAFYIRNYADQFSGARIEELTDLARNAKIRALLALAHQNLTQVRTNWSWVDK